MAKRFFIGSSFFLLLLLFLWGVYTLFFSASKTSEAPVPEIQQPTQLESKTNPSSIHLVIDAPIISPFISAEEGGNIFYIDKNTGSLQKFILSSKKKEVLTQETLVSPISAIWSKNGDTVFVKELRGNEPSFRLFSFSPQASPLSLKWGIRYLIFNELGDNILYTFQDNASNQITLNRALRNGSNWKEITKLPSLSISLQSIPKTPLVSFWEKPSNAKITPLHTVNLTNNETKVLFPGKYGADYLWSPNGEKILMSWAPEKNGSRLSLATLNKNGGEYTDLNFPTLVQKCIWSTDNTTLYCALPGSLPQGAVMPDTSFDTAFTSNDTFWKIDTKTGKSERIVSLENIAGSYDASKLLLSPDEKTLFFVNRKDLKLYSIDL